MHFTMLVIVIALVLLRRSVYDPRDAHFSRPLVPTRCKFDVWTWLIGDRSSYDRGRRSHPNNSDRCYRLPPLFCTVYEFFLGSSGELTLNE